MIYVNALKRLNTSMRKFTAILLIINITLAMLVLYLNLQNIHIDIIFYFGIFILINWHIFSYYNLKYHTIKKIFEMHSLHVISELVSTYKVFGSLIPGIVYLSRKKIPFISEDFKKLLDKVFMGEDPRIVLSHYADVQPSSTLRNGLKLIATLPPEKIDLSIIQAYLSKRLALKETSRKIEGKFALIIGILIFTPIITILIFIFIFEGETHSIPLLIIMEAVIYEILARGML